MAAHPEIPSPWVGTEDLPVHFANAFAFSAGPNAVFVLLGSVLPAPAGDGPLPPFRPVRPFARLALAPQAVPGFIESLQEVLEMQQAMLEEQEGEPDGD